MKFSHIVFFTAFLLQYNGLVFAQEANKVALVIGNADYLDAPLRNPVNDANAISERLQELGFDVIKRTNVSKAQFKEAIREFDDHLGTENNVGLFYFAGHGLQYNGDNHLVPVDAKIERAYEIDDQTIEMGLILRLMEYKHNPMNIIILDACRNNPYTRSYRDMQKGLQAPSIAPRGSYIAFATAPGNVAADGEGDNGLYTQELLRALSIPNLSIEQVFKEVRVNVANKSSEKQIPWENSSLTGEFIFNEENNVASVSVLNNTKRNAPTIPISDGEANINSTMEIPEETRSMAVESKGETEVNSDALLMVDQPAEFPGGSFEFTFKTMREFKYPDNARIKGVTGIVIVEYIVEKDGSIKYAKALSGPGAGCNEEAERVVLSMSGMYSPASHKGETVRHKMVANLNCKN